MHKVTVVDTKINENIEKAKKLSNSGKKPVNKKPNNKIKPKNGTDVKKTETNSAADNTVQKKRESSFTWRPFEEFFKTGKNTRL